MPADERRTNFEISPEFSPAVGRDEDFARLTGIFNQRAEPGILDRATILHPFTSRHIGQDGARVPGYNEVNPGIGLSIPLTEQRGVADNAPLNLEIGIYKNSYAHQQQFLGDQTLYAGISYLPLQAVTGQLKLSAGLMVGVATTARGSYAENMPEFTKGGVTGLAALTARLEDSRSGFGVQAMLVPPGSPDKVTGEKRPGFIGVAFTQKLKF
jgi:hypothetical protein